ncbi:hypothetical protein BGZ60DRAFT_522926 [Tricladium varicosporioides]|nr:hypothetical protein BGZ60DRAFT_522926 [Hymenoscyphus varicosporioides]
MAPSKPNSGTGLERDRLQKNTSNQESTGLKRNDKKRKNRKNKSANETAEDTETLDPRPSKMLKMSDNPGDANQSRETNSSTVNISWSPTQFNTTSNLPNGNNKTPFGNLSQTHDVLSMSINSGVKIEKKVTSGLAHLDTYPVIPPAKPGVVMLYSKDKAAVKMISIVEIAKREIASKGGKWFQYNVIDQVIEPKKEKVGKRLFKSTGNQERDGKDSMDVDPTPNLESEEDDDFEMMKTPFERVIEGKPRVRAVPTMTIYLSRIRIDILKKEYGEQTNGLQK